jgi:hypothetical protein
LKYALIPLGQSGSISDCGAFVDGSRRDGDERRHLLTVPLLGDHGQRGRRHQRDEAGDVVRRRRRPVAEEAQHRPGVGGRVEDRPRVHGRPHRVERQLERRDDPEVPAAAAEAPEELGVLRLGGPDDPPVGRDHVGREQVVARKAVLAHQPADPAAEREPADAGGRDEAPRGREPVRLGLVVDVGPGRPTADVRAACRDVDPDAAHLREVDDDPVVDGGEAGDAVASAAHRDRQVVAPGEAEGGGHVRDACCLDDERGTAVVVEAVPDGARFVVTVVTGGDDRAADRLPQLLERRLAEDGCECLGHLLLLSSVSMPTF